MSGFYGQVYQVVEKRNFEKDVSFDKNLTVNENASVKQDLEVGKNLTVNENASVKQGLQVGENILIQGNQISIKGSLEEEAGTYDSLVFLKDNDEAVASIAVNNVGTLVFDLPSKNSDYFERYYFTEPVTDLAENKEYYILTSKNVTDNWLSILKEEDESKLSLEGGYLVAQGFKNKTTTIQPSGISTDFINTSGLQVQSNQATFTLPSGSQELQIIIGNIDGSYTTYTLDAMTNNETFKILTNYNFKENTLLWVDSSGNFSANQSEPDSSLHFFNGKGLALGVIPESTDVFTGLQVFGPIIQSGGRVTLSSSGLSLTSSASISLSSLSSISLSGSSDISLSSSTAITIGNTTTGQVACADGQMNISYISKIIANEWISLHGLQGISLHGSVYDTWGIYLDSKGSIQLKGNNISISGTTTIKTKLILDETGNGTTKGKCQLRCFNLQAANQTTATENRQLHVLQMSVQSFIDYDGVTKSGAPGIQCGGIFLENDLVHAYGTADTTNLTMYEGRLYFQIT